jgi:beta-lactamase class A
VGLAWSYCVLDRRGDVVKECDADRLHPTASIGKVFLLCEIAERICDGRLDPLAPLVRQPGLQVADSGLWQHLAQTSLPLVDACVLVAAVSDNWATNVLIDLVGLGSVAARAEALGCADSGLHDRVRDVRTAADAFTLSTGTARELAEVARRIHVSADGGVVAGLSSQAARVVEGWLLMGVDLTLVAAPFRLDPLAHTSGSVRLWSKTGTDTCIRADMGAVRGESDMVAYAAIATWEAGFDGVADAFDRMHGLGAELASRMW